MFIIVVKQTNGKRGQIHFPGSRKEAMKHAGDIARQHSFVTSWFVVSETPGMWDVPWPREPINGGRWGGN